MSRRFNRITLSERLFLLAIFSTPFLALSPLRPLWGIPTGVLFGVLVLLCLVALIREIGVQAFAIWSMAATTPTETSLFVPIGESDITCKCRYRKRTWQRELYSMCLFGFFDFGVLRSSRFRRKDRNPDKDNKGLSVGGDHLGNLELRGNDRFYGGLGYRSALNVDRSTGFRYFARASGIWQLPSFRSTVSYSTNHLRVAHCPKKSINCPPYPIVSGYDNDLLCRCLGGTAW